jgi:aldehyde:ferredoxin oxidoreductase
MLGWTGHVLRVDLTRKRFSRETFDEPFAHKWLGGRGFALKTLSDELEPGIDPLGPENKFIVALGPNASIAAPNMDKTVVTE